MQTEEIIDEEVTVELENNKEERKEIEDMGVSEVVHSILDITQQLDELDEYFEKLSSLQSRVDEELSDLIHFIENPKNTINNRQASKLVNLIREKRLERRRLFNDFEIKRVFNENRNKICYTNQRQFFLNNINKKVKELNNDYKPRWLTNDDIMTSIK